MHSNSDNDCKYWPLLSSSGVLRLVSVLLLLASHSILQCRASDAALLSDDSTSSTHSATNNNNNDNGNHVKRQYTEIYPKPSAVLIVSDSLGRKRVQLIPGLLEETLLDKGSFSFGAKLVQFNKLKVLGNVYANAINGKPLRETYLLKNIPKQPNQPKGAQHNGQQNSNTQITQLANSHHLGTRYSAQSQVARAPPGSYGNVHDQEHIRQHSQGRMQKNSRHSEEIRLQILNAK